MRALYYGDNLHVLREHIKDESVDLIYLDPPFNSKRDYNLLFKSPAGQNSEAQIEAFEDTWHWNQDTEVEFDELMRQSNTDLAEMMKALRSFLGENDMMAYLTKMAARLLELHRALKATGSLYLHCDPNASHYLKLVLDGVFGKEAFRSEIIWRRSGAHNSAKRYGPIHDTIFFYTRSEEYCWNKVFTPYAKQYVDDFFNKEDDKGRYRTQTLTGSGVRGGESGSDWKQYSPTAKGRHWAIPGQLAEEHGIEDLGVLAKLDYLDERGLVVHGEWLPDYRQYLHQSNGVMLQDIWAYQPFTNGVVHGSDKPIDSDVRWLADRNDPERLGYPTQKPVGLLERIIQASSNEGDVIMDPFCGCGTAVAAAEKLKRNWIGIDITHLAISLIEKRMRDAYGQDMQFEVHGTPKDLASARDLAERDKYQFQWWAVSLVDAQPWGGKKKGADGGIDGVKYFHDLDREGVRKIIVSVKGGKLKADDVRALNHVREREKADIALFVSLEKPTAGMVKDAAAAGFYTSATKKQYPRVQLLTIDGLLHGQHRPEHPDHMPDLNFKKAQKEKKGGKQTGLF
jgi:DNA modification methylase